MTDYTKGQRNTFPKFVFTGVGRQALPFKVPIAAAQPRAHLLISRRVGFALLYLKVRRDCGRELL